MDGPVSDAVMQVTLSNSGANMTAKPSGITHSHAHSAICLHSAIYACTVQYACVVCRFGHVSRIYGHSHSMGTSVNVVIQEIAIKYELLLIVYSH